MKLQDESMLQQPRDLINVQPEFQAIFAEIGLDEKTVWKHPRIKIWRKLEDRENGLLETTLGDGRAVRFHIKRYFPARGFSLPVDEEIRGYRALLVEGIPTARLAGWGKMLDKRSFVISEDLSGFTPADKAVADGLPFQSIGGAIADIAAHLHDRGLHHRDLYLCHFLVRVSPETVAVRLIDTARVKRLPGFLTRQRWIVKDLAQFWYSTQSLAISDAERDAWLARYAAGRKLTSIDALKRSIQRKAAWIARHDSKLRGEQPNRNVSIPA